MGIRYLARQRVLQFLYALEYADLANQSLEQVEHSFLTLDAAHRRGWGPFARLLAEKVHAHRGELDEAIRPLLRNWTIERLPRMDLLCLRMALCELRYFPDIPLRVTMNEYIELARMFSTDESPQYINAVLDQLAKEFPEKDFQVREEKQGKKHGTKREDEEGDETGDEGDEA